MESRRMFRSYEIMVESTSNTVWFAILVIFYPVAKYALSENDIMMVLFYPRPESLMYILIMCRW